MNFLAHQHLSFLNPSISIGNFSADFIRGDEIKKLSPELFLGVNLHRKIDVFTDTHPNVIKAKQLIETYQGRYSSVVLDVYFDYFLANHWQKFSQITLKKFSTEVYTIFNKQLALFPDKVKPSVSSLIKHDWFTNYKYQEGIQHALSNIRKRATFENNIHQAWETLLLLEDTLENLFIEFYSEAIQMSHSFFEEYYLTFNPNLIIPI